MLSFSSSSGPNVISVPSQLQFFACWIDSTLPCGCSMLFALWSIFLTFSPCYFRFWIYRSQWRWTWSSIAYNPASLLPLCWYDLADCHMCVAKVCYVLLLPPPLLLLLIERNILVMVLSRDECIFHFLNTSTCSNWIKWTLCFETIIIILLLYILSNSLS